MYENFFNPKILEVLFWMMEHRGEYSANLIYEQTSLNQYTLVQYLHLLYTLDVCIVEPDEIAEELYVQLNEDSQIVKALESIQEVLDSKMNETSEIEMVLSQDNVRFTNLMDDLSQLDPDELLQLCEDIRDENTDNSPDIDDFVKVLEILSDEKKNSEETK